MFWLPLIRKGRYMENAADESWELFLMLPADWEQQVVL